MQVFKRNKKKEEVSFDKIKTRLLKMSQMNPELENVDIIKITQKVIAHLHDDIKTEQIDEISANICSSLVTEHPDYVKIGSRIIISNNHKNTLNKFGEKLKKLVKNKIISEEILEIYEVNKDKIENHINYEKDYNFDYFGFKTLEKGYLQKIDGVVIERIQDLLMRVSLGIHKSDIDEALRTYENMSDKYFIHASPTLYNAGTNNPQLLSCFLLGINDSIDGIYKCLGDCASISKWAGGIGLHISNIRGSDSYINGTNGHTSGIVPMLRVFNSTARYVNQCFLPNTPIYTIEGVKRMDDIACGDKLVTNDGSFQEVLKVYNDDVENRDILNIKTGVTNCKVTTDHPLYVIKHQQKGLNYNTIINRLNNKIIKPEYIESSKLEIGDFMIYTIPQYVHDIEEYTEDDCYMYGLMLGDGHITQGKKTEYGISLNQTTKKDLVEWVKLYLNNNIIKCWTYDNKGCYSIRWANVHRNKFQRKMLYDNNNNKIIHTSMLHLPKNKIYNILKGLIRTDGHIGKEIYYYSSSLPLIQSIMYLLMKIEILPQLSYRNRIGESHKTKYGDIITTQKLAYQLRIPKTKELCNILDIEEGKFVKFLKWNNYLMSRIKNIKYEKYTGNVIEFDIKNNHNYLTPIGIAHNGGKRLGSFAIYLEPHHCDIFEFLELKKNHGLEEERARDLFYAIWASDLFMKRVKNNEMWSLFSPDECKNLENVYGDEYEKLYTQYENDGLARKQMPAQQLWFKICISQIETGTPYLLFKDHVNRKSNQKNYGVIKSSNLCCVQGDTFILTDKGHIEIEKLYNKKVNVWNGKEFSNVKICKTGINQELVKVSLSDSSSINCTPYHKFYIQDKYIKNNYSGDIIEHKNVRLIEAQDLRTGMKIIKCDYPVINIKKELKHAYTNGIFSADGTYSNCNLEEKSCNFKSLKGKSYCKRHINYQNENDINDNEICKGTSYSKKPHITLYGEKIKLLEYLDYHSCGEIKNDKQNVQLNVNLEEKFFVPINYSIQSKMDWFSGYADGDGCITTNEGNQSLQIGSIEKEFLINIKLLLQTCGINTTISLVKHKNKSYLPDRKGNYKYFDTKPLWRIIIASNELQKLLDLGFNPKRLKIKKNNNIQRSATKFITIENIEKLENKEDVYCFNEPLRHAGIFNGVITSQCEITEYSDDKEYACCTLSSICLPSFLNEDKSFNFKKLQEIVYIVTKNLNKIIDLNFYPVKETEISNKRHRPLGIGIQGLADLFIRQKIGFDSDEAKKLNKEIFAVIYYSALEESHRLAKKYGPYETFKGSPISEGKFQFDLWNIEPINNVDGLELDWDKLRNDIIKDGIYNSLLLAPMPTASTSQIMGFNECFEPYTSFIYTRSTLAGQFEIINHELINDLIELNLWNKSMKNKILLNDGSIQNITEIPENIRNIYKNSWDLSNKVLIDMSAYRGAYVCQSQSLNLFVAQPTFKSLSSMHFYSWNKGLKTGIYYLRTLPKTTAQKFTIEPEKPCENCSG